MLGSALAIASWETCAAKSPKFGLVHNNLAVAYQAADKLDLDLQGFDPNVRIEGGACVVNCLNWLEVYSFHPSGANVAFGDGSVRFLKANISIRTLVALWTRANGDLLLWRFPEPAAPDSLAVAARGIKGALGDRLALARVMAVVVDSTGVQQTIVLQGTVK